MFVAGSCGIDHEFAMLPIIVTRSLTIGRRSRLVTLDATHSSPSLAVDGDPVRDDVGARAWSG